MEKRILAYKLSADDGNFEPIYETRVTSHQLAKQLLELPDLPVYQYGKGLYRVGNIEVKPIIYIDGFPEISTDSNDNKGIIIK